MLAMQVRFEDHHPRHVRYEQLVGGEGGLTLDFHDCFSRNPAKGSLERILPPSISHHPQYQYLDTLISGLPSAGILLGQFSKNSSYP